MLISQYERITKRIESEILAIPMQEYENDKSGAEGYSFGRKVIDNAFKKYHNINPTGEELADILASLSPQFSDLYLTTVRKVTNTGEFYKAVSSVKRIVMSEYDRHKERELPHIEYGGRSGKSFDYGDT